RRARYVPQPRHRAEVAIIGLRGVVVLRVAPDQSEMKLGLPLARHYDEIVRRDRAQKRPDLPRVVANLPLRGVRPALAEIPDEIRTRSKVSRVRLKRV